MDTLHLCFVAPFLLLGVGVDWPRWAGLASAQCAVLMLLFARDLPAERETLWPRRFVVVALGFLTLGAGSGYPMAGARLGIATSPQVNVIGWLQAKRSASAWSEPFVRPDLRDQGSL